MREKIHPVRDSYVWIIFVFSGLSFRNVSRAIEPYSYREVMLLSGNGYKSSIQNKSIRVKKRVSAFLIDETMVQIGNTKASGYG